MRRFVIFTDLDGTLLDDEYSFDQAKPVIAKLKEMGVPIVFCSAKTRAEQEFFRRAMGINDPFIVEDGSALYLNDESIVLGVEYERIVREILKLREKYEIRSYYFMSVKEVAKVTGLSLELARMAKMREFSETIVSAEREALEELKKKFNVVVGGRFVHVYGKNADKGKAVKILTEIFREKFGDVVTLGIGNSYTDESMLKAVDIPALVRNPNGWVELDLDVYKARGVATSGWVEVVKRFVLGEV